MMPVVATDKLHFPKTIANECFELKFFCFVL